MKSMSDIYEGYTFLETRKYSRVAATCGRMQLEQTYPYEYKDEYRDKVIRSRDGVFICQTEKVHDGGTHAQDTLDFVSWRLVCIDGPDLGLCRGPGSLLQVDLQTEQLRHVFESATTLTLSLSVHGGENVTRKIPLGFEVLCEWPSQLLRAAGCVHGKACETQKTWDVKTVRTQ